MTTPKAFLIGCVAAAFLAGPSLAFAPQATPNSLDRAIVTASSPLGAQQNEALEAFIGGWINVLESSSNARNLVSARQNLVDSFRDGTATPIFRRAFSGIAVPRLEPIVKGKDLQRAIMAMQVARFIGTPESIALLTARLNVAQEADAGKRLSAASNLIGALSDAKLTAVEFTTAARAIGAAASSETDALVVLQQVRALSSLVRRSDLPPQAATFARTTQVEVLRSLLQQLREGSAADARIGILNQALITLRDQWLQLKEAERTAVGPTLAPALADVFAIGGKQWETARSDPEQATQYAEAIAIAEVLLRSVDRTVRPNGGGTGAEKAIATAWDAGNKSAFDAEVAKWTTVLGAAPYK
jgi:hypothetical protein